MYTVLPGIQYQTQGVGGGSHTYILGGAHYIGHGRHMPRPHFYKRLVVVACRPTYIPAFQPSAIDLFRSPLPSRLWNIAAERHVGAVSH